MHKWRRVQIGGLAVWLILIFVTCVSVYQIYGLKHSHSVSNHAVRLLYQVSLFQMELLNSHLNEAEGWRTTSQLDALKQAAYSANYTHERLMLALGTSDLSALDSLTQLVQYIMRLQIGGERELTPEERETFLEMKERFKELYEDYGKLLAPDHTLIPSQYGKLSRSDAELAKLLRKRQMQ